MEYESVTVSGQTMVLAMPTSAAVEINSAQYLITGGSTTLNLSTPSAATTGTVTGNVTGTFTLTGSFPALTGTISGTYTLFLQ
jgi:hypothetical protein